MNQMTERKYLTALYSFLAFGPARIKLLYNFFGSYENIWIADEKKLREIGLKSSLIQKFARHRKDFDLDYFKNLKKEGIKLTTALDADYPENLIDLDDAPCVLYYKGTIKPADTNAVAIVGSRKITAYGKEVAERLAVELTNYGISIVSGLAFGVDVEAHKHTVNTGGRCLAVLASGVDIVTPRSNEWLAKKIIKTNGAIISEFPPGTIPKKQYFPHRNRIISGLSKAVVIIEGMEKSGTIHTARHAVEQGREVFAVPGQITSPMSAAPHFLIKRGAKMLTKTSDILDELNLQLRVDKEAVEKIMPTDKKEKKLVEILEREPLHLDEVARISKLPVDVVLSKLTILELKGIIKNIGNGVYRKT